MSTGSLVAGSNVVSPYRDVQKTSLSKFNQEHDGKLKHRKKNIGKQECSAENELQQEL